MKNFRVLIIFVIVLGIYGLIMFFAFGNENSNNTNNGNNNTSNNNNTTSESEKKYLVIGNYSNLLYKDGSFSNTSRFEIERLDKLKTYVNDKFYGSYKLKYISNWNLIDNNNEFVNYNGSLLAYSENFNIKVRNYKTREINEKDKLFLMNTYNLNTLSNLTTNEAVDIDLDNNGVIDEIICLSSLEPSNNEKNYYNIIVINLNGEKTTIIEEREKDAKDVYSLYGIINVENEKNDSIILTKTEGYIGDKQTVSSLMINYKNDKYRID